MNEATTMVKDSAMEAESPSRLIDARIAALGDWRGETARSGVGAGSIRNRAFLLSRRQAP